MLKDFRTLYGYRELLLMWTIRDIKVRYKQSMLGGAWAILQPLSLMVIFSLIFTYLVKVPTEGIPYPIFSYTALLPWTFFTTSISFAVPSLVSNMNLVTKVYFPREILPISAIVGSFVDFLVASCVFVGMLVFYHVPLTPTLVLAPMLLIVQILLTAGVVLLAAAANVFYRDIRFVVPLAIQLWMYATPIIYPLALIPERFRPLYMLNPMAGLIEAYRSIALRGAWPNWPNLGIAVSVSVLLFVLGYRYFKQAELQFADVI